MSGRILVIGAGAAGNVAVQKCAMLPSIFTEIHLASRTLSKCSAIQTRCAEKWNRQIAVSQIDADNVAETVALIRSFKPDVVLNMALPYQDLAIMEACLETKVHYVDTANYEPKDEAKFCYKWQWDLHERFKEAGIMALLGSGFDPGVTNVFTAHLARDYFDEIHTLDIVDCNAGDHGHPFATNFNPEINIREITQNGKYFENGEWVEIAPMSIKQEIDYPQVGPRTSYLLYHEELESLVKHFPTLKRARFWMTFGEEYITHLRVLQNVGMTRIDGVDYNGQKIVPLQFLKAVLPNPSELSDNYTGKTSIGCIVSGIKDGAPQRKMIVNVCDHAVCHAEVAAQAVSYTTGVPAMIGAKQVLTGAWSGAGVFNMEQFDPAPFLADLSAHGLPWQLVDAPELSV